MATARTATTVPADLEPVYVWDLLIRVSHWLVALSLIVLTITGIDLGAPFISAGSSGFTHGYVRIVHMYAAIVFSLAVGARVVWMFTGPRHSGWRQFIPASKKRLRTLKEQLLFYVLVRPVPPHCSGHNPLAGLSYAAVFALYLVMIFTGFALYSVSAHASYMKQWDILLPLFGGPQTTRWIHHVTMWLLVIFAVMHLCFALLTSRTEKNGTLDSIFSGYKFLSRERHDDE